MHMHTFRWNGRCARGTAWVCARCSCIFRSPGFSPSGNWLLTCESTTTPSTVLCGASSSGGAPMGCARGGARVLRRCARRGVSERRGLTCFADRRPVSAAQVTSPAAAGHQTSRATKRDIRLNMHWRTWRTGRRVDLGRLPDAGTAC